MIFRRTLALLGLALYFFRELVMANITMAYFTVMPLSRTRPGILAVPLEPQSDLQLMLLANLITLTPGTLSVEVSADGRTLYVHTMDVGPAPARAGDPYPAALQLKRGFERRVLRATEGRRRDRERSEAGSSGPGDPERGADP